MGSTGETVTGIVAAIVGVATISVILSSSANTSSVMGSAFSGFSNLLATAMSPLTSSKSLL